MIQAGLRIAGVVRSNEAKRSLQLAVAEIPTFAVEVEVGELAALNGAALEKFATAEVLFLDLNPEDERERAALRRVVDEYRGQKPIIATAQEVSTSILRQLMRDGVDDCLPQPLQREDVVEALVTARRKLSRQRGAGRAAGKVIGVMRAKGGAGASTVALNLARDLCRPANKSDMAKQVYLMDFDLQFGDLASMLDLSPRQDLGEIIKAPRRLDGALLHSLAIQHATGVHLLAAPAQPVPLESLTSEVAGSLVDLARDEFDHVVLDLPLAVASWTENLLVRLDLLLLVTQLSVPAIRQTRHFLGLLKEEGLVGLPTLVVLNRHRSFGQGSRIREAEKALGQAFAATVHDDSRVALEATNRGVPVDQVARRSRMSRDLQALAAIVRAKLSERDQLPSTLPAAA